MNVSAPDSASTAAQSSLRGGPLSTGARRILLVEDDPVSAEFLRMAIETDATLTAAVDLAHDAHTARELATHHGHALWLIDAHLPDASGAVLLQTLRDRGLQTSALAHTAETRREALDVLIAAGFLEVLQKPIDALQLQAAIRRHLGDPKGRALPASVSVREAAIDAPTCGKLPLWDNASALRALHGNADHVAAMRALFRDEWPAMQARIDTALATSDSAALRHELHKLQASCGFVGALQLAHAAAELHRAPASVTALRQFEGSLVDTLSSMPSTDG